MFSVLYYITSGGMPGCLEWWENLGVITLIHHYKVPHLRRSMISLGVVKWFASIISSILSTWNYSMKKSFSSTVRLSWNAVILIGQLLDSLSFIGFYCLKKFNILLWLKELKLISIRWLSFHKYLTNLKHLINSNCSVPHAKQASDGSAKGPVTTQGGRKTKNCASGLLTDVD